MYKEKHRSYFLFVTAVSLLFFAVFGNAGSRLIFRDIPRLLLQGIGIFMGPLKHEV